MAVQQALQATARAAQTAVRLASKAKEKTVGADGEPTLSGWQQPRPAGLDYSSPEDARAYAAAMDFTFQPHQAWFLDHTDKPDGWPGKFNASHAEIQQHVLHPGMPVGVTLPMCSSCVPFFQAAAAYEGMPLVVAGPDMVRIFLPEGTIIEIYPDGTTLRVVGDIRYLIQTDRSEVQIL